MVYFAIVSLIGIYGLCMVAMGSQQHVVLFFLGLRRNAIRNLLCRHYFFRNHQRLRQARSFRLDCILQQLLLALVLLLIRTQEDLLQAQDGCLNQAGETGGQQHTPEDVCNGGVDCCRGLPVHVHAGGVGAVHDDDEVRQVDTEGHLRQRREDPVAEDELGRVVLASEHRREDAQVHSEDEDHAEWGNKYRLSELQKACAVVDQQPPVWKETMIQMASSQREMPTMQKSTRMMMLFLILLITRVIAGSPFFHQTQMNPEKMPIMQAEALIHGLQQNLSINQGCGGRVGLGMGYLQSLTMISMKAVMTDARKRRKVMIQPSFLFLLQAQRKKGVMRNSWKSTAKYHPHPKQQSMPLGPWSPKLSMKKTFQRTPPSLQEQLSRQKILQIGPLPRQGAIFQKSRMAIMQVGQMRMNLCRMAPKQNLTKLFTFFNWSNIPSVIRNPPIQKNVSTAKQAAGTIVGRPGVVRISSPSVQFLMFMNLNHVSWPKTIQKMESTLAPFRNSKFSFSVCLGIVMILAKLSQMLKACSTLTGRLWLWVSLLTMEPMTPTRMSAPRRAMVRQLVQSKTGSASIGLQNFRFTKATQVVLVAFWYMPLSWSCSGLASTLEAMTQLHWMGAQRPIFCRVAANRLTTCMVKQTYSSRWKRQLLQSPRSFRNFPELAQTIGGRFCGLPTQSDTICWHSSSCAAASRINSSKATARLIVGLLIIYRQCRSLQRISRKE